MRALGDPAPQSTSWGGLFAPGKDATVPTYRPVPPTGTKPGRGPRPDGRRAEEMRPCHLQVGAGLNSAGSAYIEQGQTKILAAVFGPRQPWGQMEVLGEGRLIVDVQFASFSSRTNSSEARKARSKLYSSILTGALESVVLLERYAKSVIDVHLLVVEDDGSCLTVALAAASLALADAAIDMRDLVTGATVHLAKSLDGSGTLMLDCAASEESAMPDGSAVLHYGVCPTRGMVCLMHSVGPLPAESFEQMVLLAKDTAEAVGAEMRNLLEARAAERRAKRQKKGSGPGLANGTLAPSGIMIT